MRIAVINNFFPPRVGGSAHISDGLARHYAAAGHDVMVLTCAYQGAPPLEHRDGIVIYRLPSWTLPETRISFNFDINFALKPRNLGHTFRLLDRFQPEVLHEHGQFFDLTWQAGLWARRRGVPSVLTVHTRLVSPSSGAGAVFRGLDAAVVDPILKKLNPTKFVALDSDMAEYLTDRYGLPPSRVEYIPVGIELERFRDVVPADIRGRFDLGDGPVALSLGHVIPIRDRVLLVRAMPAVLERHPNFKLLVVGGVYNWAFLEIAESLGVKDAIVTTGPLPKSEIPGICASVDFECHDLQGFGIGIAGLEAMASGTPVILSARSDHWPDAPLVNGQDCLLTPQGDIAALANEMCRLIEDKELRKRVGEGGRDYVFDHLDMDRVAQRNLDLLISVAQQ